jgi:uncharacterized protein
MRKNWLIILLVAAAILLLGFFLRFKNKKSQFSQYGNELRTISVSGHDLEAEIVSTQDRKELGLSGRDEICADCTMLFVYANEGIYPFWMKDMRFDLDIIWISGNKVVYLAKNVPHAKGTRETVNPGISADKILELNAGTSDRLGIKIGDLVDYVK